MPTLKLILRQIPRKKTHNNYGKFMTPGQLISLASRFVRKGNFLTLTFMF